MNHVVLYRGENSKGKKDATGAFIPEAKALIKLLQEKHNRSVCSYSILPSGWENRVKLTNYCMGIVRAEAARTNKHKLSVSIFCHGWRRGIEFAPRNIAGAKTFAKMCVESNVAILNLFACSAAGVMEDKTHKIDLGSPLDPSASWAFWVASECAAAGHSIRILGHETPGHTTWNARVRMFYADGKEKTVQTERLVLGDDQKAFAARMKNDQEYRLMLPFRMETI
jgi:hypothetical protein